MNPFVLIGKTILVTGASAGIGKEIAIQCSNMGATVVVVGRNKERLYECFSQLKGDSNVQIISDLTIQEDIERLVLEIPDVDGVVLCAGCKKSAPLLSATRARFDEVFNINFFSPIELLRLLILNNKLKSKGSVVFISSVGGNLSFQSNGIIYGSSKAAIESAMKFCAKELAPFKIRVNCITPAKVNHQLFTIANSVNDEKNKADIENYPLARYGDPKDIAYGVIYFLSDASSWITGQSLVLDGGKTLI